jgi:GT2 family glycosyltransferase
VLKFSDVKCRIVCVDNASSDGTVAFLEKMGQLDSRVELVLSEENLGWARGSLLGLEEMREEDSHFCLLNSDTIVTPGWLRKMLSHLERHPPLAMVVPSENPESALSREAPPIAPGSLATPPPPPSMESILTLAKETELRFAGQSEPCAPSGFCVLVHARYLKDVRTYLHSFERFRRGELCWEEFFAVRGMQCRKALDTYVFHARGGSGGYYDYGRAR